MKSIFKTRSQIAEELGISRKTLYNWLKKAEIKLEKGMISPQVQIELYKKFGMLRQNQQEVFK